MTYLEQCQAISSRIRGLMRAGELHVRYLAVQSSDAHGREKRLLHQSGLIFAALKVFRETFDSSLPEAASHTLAV